MTLPATLSELTSGLARVKAFAAEAVDDFACYIKMGKDGVWTHGTDEEEIEADSEWAVNPLSFATGYSAFDDGKRVGEEMRSMQEPPIRQADLPPVGAAWTPQIGFQVKCLNGTDKDLQGHINQRSRGGMAESTKLLTAVLERSEKGETDVVPVIRLRSSSYKHQTYGRIFTPVYEIVRWVAMDSDPTLLSESTDQPAAKLDAPDAVEQGAESEEEAQPTRRRRRRA